MNGVLRLQALALLVVGTGVVSACGRQATASDEQLASAAMLTVYATAQPDTVARAAELTLTLGATNELAVGIRATGPCPSLPLRLQVVGADSVRHYALVGAAGGCKLPGGPVLVRLEPGWTDSFASRGPAGTLLSPGLVPGRYRLRAVYEAPADTAVGPWFTVVLLP